MQESARSFLVSSADGEQKGSGLAKNQEKDGNKTCKEALEASLSPNRLELVYRGKRVKEGKRGQRSPFPFPT